MSSTYTASSTYTIADIESVFRRFRADIFMIADSTKAINRDKADDYAHDVEYLAKRGYLAKIDLTLLSGGVEVKASVYRINEQTGDVTSARPGGVLWPQVANPHLRMVIWYTKAYTDEIKSATRDKLRIGWSTSDADTSHSTLTKSGSRVYSSNGYGLNREDLS